MNQVTLRADCARCAALCCVALAFDRSELFAIDKGVGEPCPHLDSCNRCGIHSERPSLGFSGCVAYDCLGAGQRVVQDLFAEASWQNEPSLLTPMLRAFATVQRLHGLLLLLAEANKLPLSSEERRTLIELEATLQALAGAARAAPEIEDTEANVRTFLRSLERHVR